MRLRPGQGSSPPRRSRAACDTTASRLTSQPRACCLRGWRRRWLRPLSPLDQSLSGSPATVTNVGRRANDSGPGPLDIHGVDGARLVRTERRRPEARRSIGRSRTLRSIAARRPPAPRRRVPSSRGPRGRSRRPVVRKARRLTCSRRPRSAHRPIRSSSLPPIAARRFVRAPDRACVVRGLATCGGVGSAPAIPTTCV